MALSPEEIEKQANEWLRQFYLEISSDPDVIAITPPEELRASLLEAGIDPDKIIKKLEKTLGVKK